MAKQVLTFDTVFKDVKSGKYHPVYFLFGEEAYYSDQIADLIEKNAIPEDEKEWNQHILYGKDIDIINLVSYVKRFPMMGEKQLIMVKEAQEIKYFSAKDKEEEVDKKKPAKTVDPFLHYLENPSTSTILVIVFKHKKFDHTIPCERRLPDTSQGYGPDCGFSWQ
jgi:DNA polymerase-3 subunit delta